MDMDDANNDKTNDGNLFSANNDIDNEEVSVSTMLFQGSLSQSLRACSNEPGASDPGVNFASVCSLMPVIVHMSFSLPWGNFERRVTRCTGYALFKIEKILEVKQKVIFVIICGSNG